MKTSYDVIVVGGGPAGMMCAGVAAARGKKVLLLEKNPELGRKLRITGGGRCNITNATFDNRVLLAKYGEAAPFLFSAFATHTVADSLDFFHTKQLATKVEAENRVFPASEKAEDVALTLEAFLQSEHVTVQTDTKVLGIEHTDSRITGIKTTAGVFTATSYVFATGGTSRPETGSTGDGYRWLEELGHTIITPTPSLVPITVHESFVSSLAGITLSDTTIGVYSDDKIIAKKPGKVLFTHNGLSGPGILNQSSLIGDALSYSDVTIKLNLVPHEPEESLQQKLKGHFITEANRKIKNVLAEYVPTALVAPVLAQAAVDGERLCNTITRTERDLLIKTLRGLTLTAKELLGPDKAIVASGGVTLAEVDFKTMKSRQCDNLFIVGDLLNILRPSGGYSLQLCWTTGFVAGSHA